MNRPPPESIPHLMPGCRLSDAPDSSDMLMIPEGAISLQGPGVSILRLCDGKRSFGAIVSELQSTYSKADPGVIETEVADFLQRLQERRVVDFV